MKTRGAGVNSHVPVLLDEVLRYLAVRADGLYVDATFGRGGHARAILAQLGPHGRLLGLDRDPEAVAAGMALQAADRRFSIRQTGFSHLHDVLGELGWLGNIHGILLDIGVSSPQLDDPARGFSFREDGPLDMRMDPASGLSAADWINAASEQEIAGVLWRYGEERASRRIAQAICAARGTEPVLRTRQLAGIIASVVRSEPGRHAATRSFQAIRIFINGELDELEAALRGAVDALAPGGRLCVISFHSLEDRIVKRFMRDHSRVDPALRDVPVVPASAQPVLKLLGRAVTAGEAELQRNPRARSAVLRTAEKLR
ncbi:MAG: 16S rRNA (cytosine(1402)-N(4))-methyltransferase RsmH [Gammaproteobacteria bacterium]|jgi:16S rRNA (cytosine1402-N4)-methyltransferase|nr:16S rRNA (cytosine(1402)-N(4))-methyltransferase RsmH [Gammaproteobacteria bacterium]